MARLSLVANNNPPVAGTPTSLESGTAIERDYSPEEEHESNGPAGSTGPGMERLSLIELGCAAALLLCTWKVCAAQSSPPQQ